MASREGSFTEQSLASGGGGSKTRFTNDTDVLDVLDFPCLEEEATVEFLRSHGRVLFFIRGPAGSSKGSVSSRLQELYPGSRMCWSNEVFNGPDAQEKSKATILSAHSQCREKATEYMKHNEPLIIIRNTNIRVWEISSYLQLAATYGYTVVILDLNKNLAFDPQVLAATNTHSLDEEYMERRLKQWEDVHPFAMGWSPRPRDAASLLNRFKEIAARLTGGNNQVQLKQVRNTGVYPFCLARVCWFGWDEQNKKYCCSEPVMRAYGSKDEISVVGYAVLGDLVLAMVHLTDVQEALIGDSKLGGDRNAASNGANDEDWRPPMFPEFDEMRCTLNLDTISTQAVGHGTLEETSASHELPPPSRLSFIVLGSTSSEPVTYSEAVRRLATLRDAVISWRYTPASEAKANVGGVVVYGARSENGCPLLILDEKTVKLDVLFTGYYQAHITRANMRCVTWSTGVACVRRPLLDTPQHVGAGCHRPTIVPGDVWCPASNTQLLEGVDVPCVRQEKTRRFLLTHGRLLFLVRGRPSCRKDAVVAELEALYPASRAYMSAKPTKWDCATVKQLHDRCFSTMEGFMKTDSAVIINQSPCVMVWETTSFIALACTYGYTVIIIDLPRETSSDSQVLITPDKAQEKPYVTYSVKRWEELHPFAMGWSARPKDAARLLRRFRQLRTVLLMRDQTLSPGDVFSSQVSPFCLARLCRFGRTPDDRDYYKSEKVRKAYGRSDTLRVFGYAISQGFVFALLELSDQQASLTRGDGGASGDIDPQSWKEVSCLVDLARFSPEEDGNDRECRVGQRVSLEDVDASRVTFMPLGSVRGVRYSYSRASGVPWALLSSRLRSWTAQSAEGTGCSKRVAGVDVYGSTGAADDVLLLVDDKTVELDVVFTGCYHPHTTALSNRIPAMPRVARYSSPERCSWRQGRRGGRPEGTLSWRR
ncbi:uncharacterized protein LOC144120954 [Amblyomma americanum]